MQSHRLLFFVIILAVCLTQFASDIYAPALPAIALNLHTSVSLVQWTMASYMIGVAVSQLIYGPLSDGIGRRIPLLTGLLIMLSGTLICLFAPNITTLIAGRLIQGCGAGACAALWRAVFRDVFTGDELSKYGSYLVTFIMFIVPAAPVLGGYLQHYFNWQANFVFMTFYTLAALLAICYGFKETSLQHHKDKIQPRYIKNTYFTLLKSRIFMGMTSATFLTSGAIFAWVTTGPILLIHNLKISPVAFGWINFLAAAISYTTAGRLNGRLVTRFGMPVMLRIGWSIMLASAFLMLTGELITGANIYMIVIPLIIFYFGSTFIWPNAFATAFTPFGHIAGFAAALYGFMQICGAGVLAALMTYLPHHNAIPLATVMLCASALAWLIYEIAVVPQLK